MAGKIAQLLPEMFSHRVPLKEGGHADIVLESKEAPDSEEGDVTWGEMGDGEDKLTSPDALGEELLRLTPGVASKTPPEGKRFRNRLKAADWEEGKHPRDDSGKFGSGSGGGNKPEDEEPEDEESEDEEDGEEGDVPDTPPDDDEVWGYFEVFNNPDGEPPTDKEADQANEELKAEGNAYRIVPEPGGNGWAVISAEKLEDEYTEDWMILANPQTGVLEVGDPEWFQQLENDKGDDVSGPYIIELNAAIDDEYEPDETDGEEVNEELEENDSSYRVIFNTIGGRWQAIPTEDFDADPRVIQRRKKGRILNKRFRNRLDALRTRWDAYHRDYAAFEKAHGEWEEETERRLQEHQEALQAWAVKTAELEEAYQKAISEHSPETGTFPPREPEYPEEPAEPEMREEPQEPEPPSEPEPEDRAHRNGRAHAKHSR